jgi:hypothetical protein
VSDHQILQLTLRSEKEHSAHRQAGRGGMRWERPIIHAGSVALLRGDRRHFRRLGCEHGAWTPQLAEEGGLSAAAACHQPSLVLVLYHHGRRREQESSPAVGSEAYAAALLHRAQQAQHSLAGMHARLSPQGLGAASSASARGLPRPRLLICVCPPTGPGPASLARRARHRCSAAASPAARCGC